MRNSTWCHAVLAFFAFAVTANAAAVKVEVRRDADGQYQLLRDGQPYLIKGAGGSASKQTLLQTGGNSFRTWGVGSDTQKQLDEAQALGLTVTVCHWLGHKEHGFSYSNVDAVKKQREAVRHTVETYKDHPAVLAWALGNEMERGSEGADLWNHLEDMARMIHEIDPNHPVMTIVAELGGTKVQSINKYCPSLDIIGINSYGGAPTLIKRYLKDGGTRPIVVTEFGPAGQWESPKNKFGAVNELTSTEKARSYRKTYEQTVLAAPGLCLGSYAFIWGSKVEATATWYGMLLPDGTRLAAVDTMHELWTGKTSDWPCPTMDKLALAGPDQVKSGDTINASVQTADPKGANLKIEWVLLSEQKSYNIATHKASAGAALSDAIEKNGQKDVTIHLPKAPGVYRLYCYVRNEHAGAALGSLPIKITDAKP